MKKLCDLSAETLAAQSKKYPIEVIGGILAEECLAQRNRLLKDMTI